MRRIRDVNLESHTASSRDREIAVVEVNENPLERICESPEHITSVERRSLLMANRYLRLKPAFDGAVAVLLFVLLLPVALVAMVLVSITSWGWPIYAQERLGRDGRLFRILKIRSMYANCEKRTGPAWSSGDNDPRITPLGRILRATHIDELPQLINVLLGQMSLVGPRPERPVFTQQLEKVFPSYHERHFVKPGITGLAQVQLAPDVEIEDVGRKLVCDLYYVQNMSLWLDIRLMICTALGAFRCSFERAGHLLSIPSLEKIECVCEEPKVETACHASAQSAGQSLRFPAMDCGEVDDASGCEEVDQEPAETTLRRGSVQVGTI